ncbi:hypothetical protein DE146DRAFT_760326 [Phaeosphaeria sp. MPI-PUGE-AT-0046c]|nr:hypothetical protein DE146DRAFT_760326 [Phaeosphaeria sp. MPI-PUGE-AT-0046c]
MVLNATWIPRLAHAVQVDNCTEAAILWRVLVNEDRYKGYTNDTYGAILHGLSRHLQIKRLEEPSAHAVFEWIDTSDLMQGVVQNAFYSRGMCKSTICPLLNWTGNPDVAGRGMLATYIVQAILISLYIPMILAVRFERTPSRNSLLRRTILAAQHSSGTFLNASFVFSIAMLCASLIELASKFQHQLPKPSTGALLVLMPFASVLPVALLQLSASKMLRRNQGRVLLWVLMAALMSAILHMTTRPWYMDSNLNGRKIEEKWERICVDMKNVAKMQWFAVAIGIFVLLGTVTYVLMFMAMYFRHPTLVSWNTRISQPLWWLGLILGFVGMWSCLGWFVHLQIKMSVLGGEHNKDAEWSFGQVLAITTWVPVLVEFAYIWWERPVEALSGRLMDPYEVQEVSKETEGFEEARRRDTV